MLGVEGVHAAAGAATGPGREALAWGAVVACQLETPLETVAWVLAAARRRGVPTLLNPAPVPDAPLEFLGAADCRTPNEGEAARLAGVPAGDAAGAARALRARGARAVIVTLGEAGALGWAGAGGEGGSGATLRARG